MKFGFISSSKNSKTGPIPTVIVSRDSCPPSCELYNSGCYARAGHVRIHWDRINKSGMDFDSLLMNIKNIPYNQVWRYGVAGDLPGTKENISESMLKRLVKANTGKRGYAYTHKNPNIPRNANLIKFANMNGFTINLSSNNVAQADDYLKLNVGPVVTLIQSDMPKEWKTSKTPGDNLIVRCPAEYNEKTTCSNCGGANGPLCVRSDRKYVIGFTTHGIAKNKASTVARNYLNILGQ